ncbi:hypothetical protein SELMODRAFT_424452 [Selaginella moellendorffii]|uniref:Uncharacterized protein n=1 Tax=Selaginella moellendorffii TaxID=88036 RepID=D8SPX9_SELML|nr:hypothetical protein SELMODRAFT_424452 [Selaginella moellendorffii]
MPSDPKWDPLDKLPKNSLLYLSHNDGSLDGYNLSSKGGQVWLCYFYKQNEGEGKRLPEYWKYYGISNNTEGVIACIWMESKGNPRLEAFLTKPLVIDVMMEFMVTSKSLQTQRTVPANRVHPQQRQRIVDYDPSLGWVSKTFQQGRIPQAVVLLYLLKLPSPELEALQLVPVLVEVLQEQVVVDLTSPALRAPRAAAIFLLEQLVSFDLCAIAKVSEGAVPYLLQCLESKTPEEQVSVMVILLCCCMEADQTCSNFIAQHCKPSKLMQLVQSHNSRSREITIAFVHSLLLARKKF